MTPEISLRLFSNDQSVLDKVFYANAYRLKPREDKEKNVVVDIGAHCGYFAMTACAMGAKKVYCFEPFYENFRMLVKNADQAEVGLIVPHQFGVFPQAYNFKFNYPEYGEKKFFDYANIDIEDKKGAKTSSAPCITLDEVLGEYVSEPIDILKIHIGYAEEAILQSSNLLASRVQAVCGATIPEGTGPDKFKDFMAKKGFVNSHFGKLPDDDKRLVFMFSKEPLQKYFIAPRQAT